MIPADAFSLTVLAFGLLTLILGPQTAHLVGVIVSSAGLAGCVVCFLRGYVRWK